MHMVNAQDTGDDYYREMKRRRIKNHGVLETSFCGCFTVILFSLSLSRSLALSGAAMELARTKKRGHHALAIMPPRPGAHRVYKRTTMQE